MEIKPVKKPISKNPYLWTILAIIIGAIMIYVSWWFYANTANVEQLMIQPI
ncbi:MAG: hypothetical protein ACTSW4_03535 [Candidatus Ranarchaeia archaeon]